MAKSSKESILSSIRQHTIEQFPRPDLSGIEAHALTYADPVDAFSKALVAGGGHAVLLPEGNTLGQLIAKLYPDAKRVANTMANLSGTEALPGEMFNPDEVEQPALLNGTDLAIVNSPLGVAENACCWIEETVRHRAIFFIAEALVIVLHREDIVNNMHEAYLKLPDNPTIPFNCFISGPSKTADIEQALVFGAHGAKDVTVIIV